MPITPEELDDMLTEAAKGVERHTGDAVGYTSRRFATAILERAADVCTEYSRVCYARKTVDDFYSSDASEGDAAEDCADAIRALIPGPPKQEQE